MSIYLNRNDNVWILEYTPELINMNGVYHILSTNKDLKVGGVFYFSKNNLVGDIENIKDSDSVEFIFANRYDDYFKIDKMILRTHNDILFYHDVALKVNYFKIAKNTSVMRLIEKMIGQVIIGGELTNSISKDLLKTLIKKFPNNWELQKYINARVYGILKDSLNISDKPEIDYLRYLRNKNQTIRTSPDLSDEISVTELEKYKFLHAELSLMLAQQNQYNELDWQHKIMNILLLIYPKYIFIYKNVQIQDSERNTNRYLDYMLVDFTGNIDIVEIKKPFNDCLITKTLYRDNHVPLRELSGAVMQIEKYIYNLLRSGKNGETALNDRLNRNYNNQLQNANIKVKIINPKGLIIMGREINLSSIQKCDFEFIKRKFKNIIDILTYDDLLQRINSLIKKFTAI